MTLLVAILLKVLLAAAVMAGVLLVAAGLIAALSRLGSAKGPATSAPTRVEPVAAAALP